MLSRSIGCLTAVWLPCLALVLPFSRFHAVNAIVAGTVATILAAFAIVSDRARLGAAIVGLWVAFTPLVVQSSLLELVLCGCWGVTLYVSLVGPFSSAPQSTFVRQPAALVEKREEEDTLPIAA
jgi:hypothetical protein